MTNYNYFRKRLPCWNEYLEEVSPEVVMPCKKLLGTGNREFLIYLIYSNKSVCLQLIKQSSQVMSKVRNSRSEVFCKKGVLTNFTKFTGKQLWQRLFFKKVAGLNACNFNKKNLCHRCFPVNFVRFLRIPFIIEHLWWLLLQGYLNF